jgi:hypothetical protein
MRELGRRSAKARSKPNPDRVPASLREELRKLDPAIVRGAIEQALAGNNESARVSAVKLLADVDAFGRKDNLCSRCGMTPEDYDAEAHGARERLIALVEGRAERRDGAEQRDESDPEVLRAERDEAILERDQALSRLAEFTASTAGA